MASMVIPRFGRDGFRERGRGGRGRDYRVSTSGYNKSRFTRNLPSNESNTWKSTRKNHICVEHYDTPLDPNGNIRSVPMNIEIEHRENENYARSGENDREKELMDYFQSEFIADARLFGIEIINNEKVQFIKEAGRYVLCLQLSCSSWNEILIPFMHSFFASIKRNIIATHEMPLVSTYSHLLYPLRVISAHENVPIAQVKFASIINNGQLGYHWNMIGGKTSNDQNDGFSFHTGVYVYFEYDKDEMYIDYNNWEKDVTNRDQENEIRGKITIDFSTIRRIIFDQGLEEPSNGNRRISLILIVDSPPMFRVRKNEKWGRKSQWDYRAELQRGAYPGEVSDRETLHDSKAIILDFDTFLIRERMMDRESSLDSFFFDLLSRMNNRTRKSIEFASIDEIEMIKGEVRNCWRDKNGTLKVNIKKVHPYDANIIFDQRYLSSDFDSSTPFFDKTICGYIEDAAEILVSSERISHASSSITYHVRWKTFRLRAFLQGILDRGMEFRIELLRSRSHSPLTWHKFVRRSAELYVVDEKRTLYALERVMSIISEERPNCSIPFLFEKEYKECTPSSLMAIFNEEEQKEGYWRIMKLVVTPTRVRFVGYETIMGNRVLNMYAKNENHIIRLAFREDRGGPMRVNNYSAEVQNRIREILINGITYAGRTYAWLGNSNSQIRDQGCYMMHVDFADRSSVKPHDIRLQMGKFHNLANIPKMISRFGQAFTQCKPSALEILPSEVGMEWDYTGGMNSAGKPYTFSDGVGLISSRHAAALTQENGINGTASAFQIRFRGEKGLLCVDPLIDKKNEIMELMGRDGDKKNILIRPSMSKFDMTEGKTTNLEIVKLSSSAATFLNRPLINILCQVSERQGVECHRRVRGRVGELMNSMVMSILQTLYVEERAFEEIKEMPIPFSSSVYTQSCGLTFTTEPFFRSLLRANAKFALQRQMDRMNIRISSSNGRLMFGVVDTSGLLQYGQVYCQYSGSVRKQGTRMRSFGGQQGIVHTGKTMITKNPCVSAGDVRMFDAVDIPALSHLIDVIVFPQHGPRPHPDEMAGSDLDGDEYIVIWDKELLLERNEEASLFPIGEDLNKWAIPKEKNGNIDLALCEQKKAEFYTEAIVYGQPGSLCNSHLAISDLHGLYCKSAESLAMKIAQTLDYSKSGIRPMKITTMDMVDPDDPTRVIPAEKSYLKPHFFRNYNDPGYVSRGIVADVFDEARKYEHALDCEGGNEKIVLDPSFIDVHGWEDYKSIVENELANYTQAMKYVFHSYGIASEEEMISGMIISMKNRLSDTEEFDGTLFTTNKVIEGKVGRINENAREIFFKNLIDWKTDLEEIEGRKKVAKSDSIMNKCVKSDTKNMDAIRKKAAAAYNVAYEAANRSIERDEQTPIILSYPWIVYDVLLDIKMNPNEKRVIPDEGSGLCKEPIAKILSESIDRYCENSDKYYNFVERFDGDNSIVGRSMRENDGLARASFVVLEWAKHVGALNNRFRDEHLLSLFILFGLGEVTNRGMKRKFIQKPQGDRRDHPRKGDHLLLFFEFISSREFRMRSTLSFGEIGRGIMMRGEWKAFSDAALSSFLSLISSMRLDLPMEGSGPSISRMREFHPRAMKLPDRVISHELETVETALRTVSGCKSVKLRDIKKYQLAMVSAVGTSEQLKILASFIYPPAPPRDTATQRGTINNLSEYTYKRIMEEAKKIH